ncbi:hypothetical protein KDL45_13565 [bacterium]|nr:hypothetical protein [bacterium]
MSRRRNGAGQLVGLGLLLLVLVLAVWTSVASATPVGGTAANSGAPGFIFNSGVGFTMRDMEADKDDQIVDEAQSSRFLAKLDVVPSKYIDAYGLIGAADFQLDDADYRGTLATAYGGGARGELFPLWFYSTPFRVAVDVNYLTFTTEDTLGGQDIKARYEEYQASALLAYQWQGITPYGGFKYNPTYVTMEGSRNNLVGDTDYGVFIGLDYFVTPNVFFAGELSIFAETSIFLAVGFTFPENR